MISKAIKTNILQPGDDIFEFIKNNVHDLQENDVLVIASKVISLSENRLVDMDKLNENQKFEVMKNEAEYYIDPKHSLYGLMVTIKNSRLGLKAGVDQTNSPKNTYILWPENPQKTANEIWNFLRQEFRLTNVGVVIADTTSIPLRKGFIGGCVSFAGFKALVPQKKEDLFGKQKVTSVNIADAVSAVGVLEMGEIDEQTPLCIVRDVHGIIFEDTVPGDEELGNYYLDMNNDVFAPVLKDAPWENGGYKNNNV